MRRKYPKVKGHWNYCFIFPDGMFYIGRSGGKDGNKQCCQRWVPKHYKDKSVWNHIEKYGWENTQKVVLCDGLTEEQSKQLEDLLIQEARKGGWCINDYRSGEITKDNKTYQREWQRKKLQNDEYKLLHKNREIERRKTPEVKIYHRVSSFNKCHPDRMIETPLEAKQKYIETGYIPNYIKNKDLIMKG